MCWLCDNYELIWFTLSDHQTHKREVIKQRKRGWAKRKEGERVSAVFVDGISGTINLPENN